MRFTLATLVCVFLAGPVDAQFPFDGCARFHKHVEISGDWYPQTSPAGNRIRTNHTLAWIQGQFTNTNSLSIQFDTSFIAFPAASEGTVSWRISKVGSEGIWHDDVAVVPNLVLATDLVRTDTYILEFEVTLMPTLDPLAVGVVNAERWRDFTGIQGHFIEVVGVSGEESIDWLPMPVVPELEYIVYGDSLCDGLVPLNAANLNVLHPMKAAATWPALAIRAASQQLGLKPNGINHSFAGWWGCQIEFPIGPYPNLAALKAAYPYMHPGFGEIVAKSHITAPAFRHDDVDLVIYALGNNDPGTGRLANPLGYAGDIVGNVAVLHAKYPNAKILVASSHSHDLGGIYQRHLMSYALERFGYRELPWLDFVNMRDLLSFAGVGPQPLHPEAEIHEIWADFIQARIVNLLNP